VVNLGDGLKVILYPILFLLSFWIFGFYDLLFGQPEIGVLYPDSNQYLQYASELLGAPFVPLGDNADFIQGSLVRQPLYPVLIAAFSAILGSVSPKSIILLHSVFPVVTLVYAFFVMTRGSFVTFWMVTLPICWALDIYRLSLMTEWLVFNLLIILFLTIVRYHSHKTKLNLTAVSLTCGALVLTRFEFFPFLALPIVLAGTQVKKTLFQSLIGIFVVASAIIPQFVNYGRFTWGDLSKAGTFALVSGLGTLSNDVDPRIKSFSEPFRKDGATISLGEAVSAIWFNSDAFFKAFGVNDTISNTIRVNQGLTWQELYEMQGLYSRALIREFPFRYVALVVLGVSTLIWIMPFGCLVFLRIKRDGFSSLAVGAATLISVHILRTIFISFINIQYIRYYAPTFAAAFLASVVFVLSNNPKDTSNNRGEKTTNTKA
jgi:hypothetical protein